MAIAVPAEAVAAAPSGGLVVSYDLRSGQGTTVIDSSGAGRNATLNGDISWAKGGLRLGGTNGYVKLPDDVLAGLDQITVTAQVKADAGQRGPMVWALGNTGGNGVGNGYLFTGGANGSNYRTSIATGNWSTEQTVSPGSPVKQNAWTTLTYTLGTDDVATLYADGVQVAQKSGVTINPGAIGNGSTSANYLGRAVYAADPYFAGQIRQFSIYDHALSAAEVTTLGPSVADRVAADKEALSLGDTSAVTADLTLPTTAENGSAINWATSDAEVVASNGTITRAASARTARLTATLTAGAAGDTASDTKTFDVTVAAALTEQQRAGAAAAAISVPNIGDARGNLTLPTTGANGATISWTSSAPAVVSTTGVVTRPANGQPAAAVDLTATVTVGSATASRVLNATIPAKPKAEPYAGYMFSYFTGNSVAGENIYFAASQGNNALQWTELNGGQPKLTSSQGTKGLRDPFIIRSPEGDKFYLIATDLSIGSGTSWGDAQTRGSNYLEIWESTDLGTWSAQRHVKISPDNAGNTWAPEAYWDDSLGAYVVFWASSLFGPNDPNHTGSFYQTMLYATTRDFVTFSEAKTWQDFGASRIDSTVIKDQGTYYRFTKDEGGVTGCSDIIEEKSDSLTAVDDKNVPGWSATNPNWKIVASCLGKNAGTGAVEGPTVFKANDGDTSGSKYYLFVDEYGGRGYIPLGSNSLSTPDWKVPASYRLPSSPRHGTVMPVTAAELARLTATPAVDPVKADADGLVARYPLDAATGTTAPDSSGHGYDATLTGGATVTDGAVSLNGSGAYVKLPNNMMAGLDAITVSSKVWIDSAQRGNYFLFGLGNTDAGGVGKGYLFATGTPNRAAIASGNWTTEQGIGTGRDISRGAWHTVTYTQAGTTSTYYLDGVKVGENTGVTTTPGSVGGGRTTANAIGKSVYAVDGTLTGKVRDFRIYNRALSAQEVASLGAAPTAITAVALDSLKVAPILDGDQATITLPVKPGTDLTTLNPSYVVAAGSTVDVSGPADYSSPRTVTVKGAGGESRAWTVTAVQMRSPVLPGLYADPNIAVFDGTYYIYATTDGVDGWGGNTFYVWKSTDLVTWTRAEKPFLTLDGANGNVPWASGNAWAPTIIERGGKYYFYFSGHNPTYDRKTIGVAVADSPEGPFTAQPTAMILNNESVTSGQAIDPAAFQDPATGKYYLFWGNGSPLYGELSDDMLSIKPGSIKRIDGLTDFREGSFVNYRNGMYHLTYSIDDTGSPDYRVGYATSTSIDGPWTYRGVILQKNAQQGILGTGHSSIIQVPGTDQWYIAYHRFAIPGGNGTHRETTVDRLTFTADGTMAPVVPTLSSVDPFPVPTGPAATASISKAGADGWYGRGAQLSVAADGAAALQYRIGEGPWTSWTAPVTLAAGTSILSVRAQGTGGPWGPVQTVTAKVDLDLPTVDATLTGRSVTMAAVDSTSGVATVEYQVDGGAWSTVSGPVTLDDKAHTVTFRATDIAGNVSTTGTISVPVTVATATVTLTSTGPATAEGWYQSSVIATVSAPQGFSAQYNLDERGWRSASSGITISGSKVHTLQTRLLQQGAEVTGSRASQTVRIDAGKPTATAVRNPGGSGTPRNPVLVRLGATDAVSGVALVEYKLNGGAWKAAGADDLRFDQVGNYLVTYRATDRAGNVSTERSTSVIISGDPATTLAGSTRSAVKGAFVTFTLKGFDRYDQISLSTGGTVWGTVTTAVDGSAKITLAVPDYAAAGSQTITAVGVDPAVIAQAAITIK